MAILPKAILFDLDNTLTNRRASVTAFARRFYLNFAHRLQLTEMDDLISIIQEADGGGYRPLNERWQILQDTITWCDMPTSDELRDYWYTALGKRAIGVVGLHVTLATLEKYNIKLGIITNGPTGLQNLTIDTLTVRDYMACVLVSETVGIKKPDPKIYHIALEQLHLSAGEVWFVGDNPSTDLLGGHNVGMTTIWIRGHHEWEETSFQPDYQVDNISEILALLDLT